MTTELNSYEAREEAATFGEVIGTGNARHDGGWDFLVETTWGDAVVTVVRDEITGELYSEAA